MKNKFSGFTLIEILIVIVIISIITSVAMLTIHINKNKQLESLAHSMRGLILLAEQEALLRPGVLGLALTPHQYQLYLYDDNKNRWHALPNTVFKAHFIPEETQVTLKIHNQIMPADGTPRLIISQNGETPAFVISIGKPEQEPLYQVEGNENGEVHVK